MTSETEARRPARMSPLIRMAGAGAVLGLLLIRFDAYFGHDDGALAFLALALIVLAGICFEFLAASQSLMRPRRLDFPFVAGSAFRARKTAAFAAVKAAARRQAAAPLAALMVLGAVKRLRLSHVAEAAGLLGLESIAVTSVFLLLIRLDWLPLSRRKFEGEGGQAPAAVGLSAASFFLRRTYGAARILTAWVPAPYGWIIRRKLLYLFRIDTVATLLYLFLLAALGAQFNLTFGAFAAALYALTGCMLSLTLIQIGSAECEDYYRRCGYFLPQARMNFRANLLLFLLIAAGFSAWFALTMGLHLGSAAFASQSFWQGLVTIMAFPFLVLSEKSGRIKSPDSRAVLNFSYLGIAGVLFMFPVYGLLMASGALLAAAARCLALAGTLELKGITD